MTDDVRDDHPTDHADDAISRTEEPQNTPDDAEPSRPSAPAETAVRPGRRWRRVRRRAAWTVAVVVVLALIITGVVTWDVRRAFPTYTGTLTLRGLSAPVTVYRDDHATPQLYARTADDLFMAQGYVAAQERFFEMDFRRHLTSGRLSEMFGADQIDTDRYLRTMGWRTIAELEWKLISPASRTYLQDYANGVNAYLGGKTTGDVSFEYSVLGLQHSGYRIAPWDAIDSLAWLKALAFDLMGNMYDEIDRSTLLASGLSRAQVESLYPSYPYAQNAPIVDSGSVADGTFRTGTAAPDASVPLARQSPAAPAPRPPRPAAHGPATADPAVPAAAIPVLAAVKKAFDLLPDLTGDNYPGIGSNAWAIAGALTTTGKPILANDPHLSPSMPGIWYQMGLHCACAFNVEGFTFSGVPGVVIGHNARIAWGFTNLDPDVTDLYLEKIRANQYEVDGQWHDLVTKRETINVAGGKPYTFTVRSTNNGPLMSDVDDTLDPVRKKPDVDPSGRPAAGASTPESGVTYGVALRWTALDPGRTMDALFAVDEAANWTGFRHAASLFDVPAQNMVYADVDGNIGYQSPGRIPIRGRGDGRWPAPGWDSRYNWTGYLSFAALPSVLNPPKGYVATANQAVINPDTYQPFLTDDWSYGYRSQRIADIITASATGGHRISVADVQKMQFDNRNDFAAQIVPTLLTEYVSGDTAKALHLLDGWDFQQPADGDSGTAAARSSAAAAFFNAFWHELTNRTFDEVPVAQRPDGNDRWFVVFDQLLQNPGNTWWDTRSTPTVEKRDDIVTASLDAAARSLSAYQGPDPDNWRWGEMHTLYVQNQSLGTSGIGIVDWLFNYGPIPVSGGSSIVNATGSDISAGYDVNEVPSMRMIVDLSNLDASRWIQLTGESGHTFSAHYHDQIDLWRTGRTLPMRWTEPGIKAAAKDTLMLKP